MRTDRECEQFSYEENARCSYTGGNLHYHDRLEIYYLKEGRCRYFIDKETYDLRAGDMVIIPAGVLHTAVYGADPHSRCLINCGRQYIPASVYPRLNEMTHICRRATRQGEVEARLSRIAREYAASDEFSFDVIRYELAQLLILLARSQRDGDEVAAERDFVTEAISYMQAHYAGTLTLREVAAHCAVSYEHLSRTFKKRTGFGFNEYLTLYRLKQAEALLLGERELSVGEIAYRCGFNDSNYFAERFGQIYGLPPTSLRRQGREAAPRKIFLP